MNSRTLQDASPAIYFDNVWFSYGKHMVLKGVNISVREGDFLGIIGPNGGGKTTFIKLALGLLSPQKGTILIFGQKPSRSRKLMGYVPQHSNLNIDFPISAMEVVLMGRLGRTRIGKRYSNQDREKAEKALKSVKMWDLKDSLIWELSGGQQRRVFLARALASEPKILFLDEPTLGIDSPSQKLLYDILRELNKQMTIGLVSHDTAVISRNIKSVACVNQRLFHHDEGQITKEMLDATYQCPVDLIAHGLPHRVFNEHDHETHQE